MKCVYGRAGVRYVITKFSRMDSLPNFLTHGAPLRARFARAGAPLLIIALENLCSLIGLTISCPDFTINIGIEVHIMYKYLIG